MSTKAEALSRKVMIDGEEYYSKIDFSTIINKFPSAVSKLIHKGNKFRKLKAKRLGNNVYILASELTEYPHCPNGKAGQGDNPIPYYYDYKGNIIPNSL